MKYFTPELYVRGNSSDDRAVDRAEREWAEASTRYRRHYEQIAKHLPPSVREFHDEICLHDADVFMPAQLSQPIWPGRQPNVVLVTQNVNTLIPEHFDTLITLQYAVTEAPAVEVPIRAEVFTPGRPVWLYDEIDLVKPGIYAHDILLSTGQVVKLRFKDFRYQVDKLIVPLKSKALNRTAKRKAASA